MVKLSQVIGIFTPSVTNQKHGRIIAIAWYIIALVVTKPM